MGGEQGGGAVVEQGHDVVMGLGGVLVEEVQRGVVPADHAAADQIAAEDFAGREANDQRSFGVSADDHSFTVDAVGAQIESVVDDEIGGEGRIIWGDVGFEASSPEAGGVEIAVGSLCGEMNVPLPHGDGQSGGL